MVSHWKLDVRVDKTVLFLQKYRWNEHGLHIEYLNEDSEIRIQITFPVRVEFFQFRFIELSMLVQDDIYNLMRSANCEGPINPFFYQTLSDADIRSFGLYLDPKEDRGKLIKYTMNDHDTWLTVVSSVPPKIFISENKGEAE